MAPKRPSKRISIRLRQIPTLFETMDALIRPRSEGISLCRTSETKPTLADYYAKLDGSLYYFIPTFLHPYYKQYCDNT